MRARQTATNLNKLLKNTKNNEIIPMKKYVKSQLKQITQ